MIPSTHPELKLREKKINFKVISTVAAEWGLKLSFEVIFILTTYTNYFLQLNKMRYQDERHLCIVSFQHKQIKPHIQNKDKGAPWESYVWQSVFKPEMVGITTYIIVIIIAKNCLVNSKFSHYKIVFVGTLERQI